MTALIAPTTAAVASSAGTEFTVAENEVKTLFITRAAGTGVAPESRFYIEYVGTGGLPVIVYSMTPANNGTKVTSAGVFRVSKDASAIAAGMDITP